MIWVWVAPFFVLILLDTLLCGELIQKTKLTPARQWLIDKSSIVPARWYAVCVKGAKNGSVCAKGTWFQKNWAENIVEPCF